jgi:anaerobic selenocysteine-containing dehydrogenase
MSLPGFVMFPEPWARYTPAVVPPPAGSDVREDWYFLWAIAKRLGGTIVFDGKIPLDMNVAPTTDDLLAIRTLDGRVTFDALKDQPRGVSLSLGRMVVAPRRPEATATFDVMPRDVAEHLRRFIDTTAPFGGSTRESQRFTHLLVSHRMRDVLNSQGLYLKRTRQRVPHNPAYLHPDDLALRGLRVGDRVEIVSDHGRVVAILATDPDLKPGVIAMSHGWGAPPDSETDPASDGAAVNRLISTDRDMEPINAMPRMSAIPVNIVPMPRGGLRTAPIG